LRTLAGLDAVTIAAYGTLVTLIDPVPALREALTARGAERTSEQVRVAFEAEAAYYTPRSHEKPLEDLRRRCVEVFLRAAEAELDVDEFVGPYVDALLFEPLPGAVEAVDRLRAHGLALAVVSNWDETLPERLDVFGIGTIVSSAEVGVPKPDPAIFRLALERLGVQADRALHIGDSRADEEGARAAGMRFVPAPVENVFG
jgi:HAD superfamily hydrolase (TIGR01509 family)